MTTPAEVALAMRRVVDDVRGMVVSASLHASNLMIYKTRNQKAQQAHKAAGEAAKFESQADSIALQLPENLAFHLKWLAWNAAPGRTVLLSTLWLGFGTLELLSECLEPPQ